jgi:hypothetical protein
MRDGCHDGVVFLCNSTLPVLWRRNELLDLEKRHNPNPLFCPVSRRVPAALCKKKQDRFQIAEPVGSRRTRDPFHDFLPLSSLHKRKPSLISGFLRTRVSCASFSCDIQKVITVTYRQVC